MFESFLSLRIVGMVTAIVIMDLASTILKIWMSIREPWMGSLFQRVMSSYLATQPSFRRVTGLLLKRKPILEFLKVFLQSLDMQVSQTMLANCSDL